MRDEVAPRFSARVMIETLARHRVDFVVVGGFAAVVHGSPRVTDDLDICASRDDANLDRLAQALVEMQAKEWDPYKGEVVDRPWSGRMLRGDRTWILVTASGALDVLFEPAGVDGYDRLARRARVIQLEGTSVNVASLDDLLRMKEAAGRDIDLGDIAILRRLQQAAEQSDGS